MPLRPRRGSLAHQAGINGATQLVGAAGPVLMMSLISRALGPSETGRYGLLVFLAATGATLATLGLPGTVSRYLALLTARGESAVASAVAARAFAASLALSVVLAFALVGYALVSRPTNGFGRTAASVVAATLIVASVSAIASAVLAGEQRFEVLLRAALMSAPLGVAFTYVALQLSPTPVGALVAGLCVALVNAILLLWPARSALEGGRQRMPPGLQREVRRYVGTLSAIALLDLIVWQRVEVVFLARYASAAQMAYYTLPFVIVVRVMALVPGALNGVLLPRFTREHSDVATHSGSYSRALLTSMILTAPVVTCGVAFARPLCALLFGPGYAAAADVMRILLVGAGFGAVGGVGAAAVYAAGRQTMALRTLAVLAPVTLALDLLLIPPFGAIGAAVANSATQILGITTGFSLIYLRTPLRAPAKPLLLALLSAVVAAALASGAFLAGLGPSATLLSGGAVFLAAYLPCALRLLRS